ncbi:BppU family phage baseplate upper protein [Listeria rocourtiae]|uniref:GDSL-type esterase/lipase family protein n=1 Tax=Listeria rocourtiae TaxID=647910 RepID=UPI003D2F6BF4
MINEVHKDLGTKLEISSYHQNSIDLRGSFSTQDIKTARLIFDVEKDTVPFPMSALTATIYMKGNNFVVQDTCEVNKELSQISYILNDETIKHFGPVQAEIYLRFNQGQSLSVHKFHFTIDQALIDQDLDVIYQVYIRDLEDIKDEYLHMFDGFKTEVLEIIQELETETGELSSRLQELKEIVEKGVLASQTNDGLMRKEDKVTVDTASAAMENVKLLSTGFEKLRMGQAVKILCYGDSLTYGYDIYSVDKRPPDSVLTPNGTAHTRERASITYPEALETALKQLYPSVSVKNCGYSGDTVISSYSKWDGVNFGADISLFMLGHNDSKNATESIDDFVKGYKKIIERALAWGSAVIFLTPPKQKNGADATVDVYSQSIIQLAKEYHAPVIDMSAETAGIPANFYSDTVHFNGTGYTFIGNKIASLFINKSILNMNKVKDHEALSVTKENSGIQYNDKCTPSTSEFFPTEDSTELGKGIALVLKPGGKAYFSFYAEEGNLLIFPSIYASSKTLNLKTELNFGAETSNNVISYANGTTAARVMNKSLKSATYLTADLNWYNSAALYIDGKINASKLLFAARKGYYTVSIENLDPTYSVNLFGLEFRNTKNAMYGNNTLYTLGTITTDILTLGAGSYELYSSNAINMPFSGAGLAALEIYIGGNNRKMFRVANWTTRKMWQGMYNPAVSSEIAWEPISTEGYVDAYFENKVIFSGAVYMLAGQSYAFDFSKMKRSLFVRVSRYLPGTGAYDYGFETFEFHKKDIVDLSGFAHWRNMPGRTDNAKKAFYISPLGNIKGHDDNAASPNSAYAIREIWYD